MIPEGILEKYIKVRKLAHHGVAGEATAAQRVLKTLESRYPGIRAEADVWERADMDVEDYEEPPPPPPQDDRPHWSDVVREQQQQAKTGRWKDQFSQWGKAAGNAFSWAADMAGQAFDIREAQLFASAPQYSKVVFKDNPTGSISINVKVPPEVAWQIDHRFTTEQKMVFARTLGERVARLVYTTLTVED
jgi:hypothetical protein